MLNYKEAGRLSERVASAGGAHLILVSFRQLLQVANVFPELQ